VVVEGMGGPVGGTAVPVVVGGPGVRVLVGSTDVLVGGTAVPVGGTAVRVDVGVGVPTGQSSL
jgi:hypothetical protein